jgi:16S rRNA (cytosine967-C5)-methyltransferase
MRQRQDMPPEDRGFVSRLVFSFFRWRGWLADDLSLERQLEEALVWERRFAENPESFSFADLARRAVPAWLGNHLTLALPWLRALQRVPPLWLRARPGQGPALARDLGDCRPAGDGWQADALRYTGSQDLFRSARFQSGACEVQDLSSQAVSWLCGPRPGEAWWDACAGEGGKTLHLSDLMQNQGLIWASDRSRPRLEVLKRRAARARVFNYRAAFWDGSQRLPTATRFDGVLVDAPCTGVGTWHRNPDARWTTTADDVLELGRIQVALLRTAASAVKPGGRLIYAVCTLTRAETDRVAEEFSAASPDFEPLVLAHPFDPAGSSGARHWLRTEACGGNGMFVVGWRRCR